ncbi:MAG TPA: hypothetical protein VIL16_19480 [Trebonia sp.]
MAWRGGESAHARRPPPPPPHAAENSLGYRLANLVELSEDDLASLLHMLDALVAKNRPKTLAEGIS